MSFRWWRAYWAQELKRLFAYRTDFWIQFLVPVVGHFTISLFLWRALFSSHPGDQIGGYTLEGMIWYSFVASMLERIVMGGQWKDGVSTDIYQGSLTKFLLYPRPYLPTKASSVLATVSIGLLQLCLLYGLATWIFPRPSSHASTVLGFLLSLGLGVFGAMLYFLLLSTIELTAFWADNVWSLQVMLRFTVQILGGVLLPLSWYPELVQSYLQYTPFPHLFYAPVQGLLGLKTPEELLPSFLNLALWSLVTVVLFRLVWRRGLKSYAGVGI